MSKYILAAVAAISLGFSAAAVRAADEGSWTGALVDNACGAKQKDETAATKHTVACCKRESCEQSGYQLISAEKHLKLDEHGNELAKKYLADAKGTKVTITGTVDGDTLKATEIKAASGDAGKGSGADHEEHK